MITKSPTEVRPGSPSKAECRSMTGYAMVARRIQGWSIRISVKSVNHRFLDVKLRIPDSLEPYEHRLRQAVRGTIHRGHRGRARKHGARRSRAGSREPGIVEGYMRRRGQKCAIRPAAKRNWIRCRCCGLPGVITGLASALPETEEEQEELGKVLETYLQEALGKMDEMRRNEGRHLDRRVARACREIAIETEQVRELVSTLRPAFARVWKPG